MSNAGQAKTGSHVDGFKDEVIKAISLIKICMNTRLD